MGSSDDHLSESFVRALLAGQVELSSLSPFPHLSQGRAEQLADVIARLKASHHDPSWSAADRLRDWELLGDHALWSTPLWCRLIRQLAMEDVSAALCATVHSALGVRLVQTWGREDQLRAVRDDPRALCAFSLTEESPGSDVSRVMTQALPVEDGFVLNGTKHWVTNAESATHFIVFARTVPPIAADKPRLTAFLVPRGKGIHIEEAPTDVLPRAGVAQVRFVDVRLDRSSILGQEGKGFRVVMSGLSEARLFVSAAMLGSCVAAYNSVVERLQQRRAFGRPVAKFPSVQFGISAMLGDLLAMESLVHGVAGLAGHGAPVDPVERGIVRLSASRCSKRVLENARELYGAAAFKGESSIARRWADTRALGLLDGSDSALESYIVLEGTRSVRHRLEQVMDATDPLGRVDAAASILFDKVGARFKRAIVHEVPGLRLQQLYAHTAQLSEQVERSLLKYKGEIVEKQHVHRRLATIVADLSTWVALAARVQDEIKRAGSVGGTRMVDVASIWVLSAHARVEQNFQALGKNDDRKRDEVAVRAYSDRQYPFDVF